MAYAGWGGDILASGWATGYISKGGDGAAIRSPFGWMCPEGWWSRDKKLGLALVGWRLVEGLAG